MINKLEQLRKVVSIVEYIYISMEISKNVTFISYYNNYLFYVILSTTICDFKEINIFMYYIL